MQKFVRPVLAVLVVVWTVRCVQAAMVLSDRQYIPAIAAFMWVVGTTFLLVLLPFSRWLTAQWRRT